MEGVREIEDDISSSSSSVAELVTDFQSIGKNLIQDHQQYDGTSDNFLMSYSLSFRNDNTTQDLEANLNPKRDENENNNNTKWTPTDRPIGAQIGYNLEDDEYLLVDVGDKGDLYTSQTFINSSVVTTPRHVAYPSVIPESSEVFFDIPHYSTDTVKLDLDILGSGSDIQISSVIDNSKEYKSIGSYLYPTNSTTPTVDLVPLLQSQIGLGYVNNLLLTEADVLDYLGKHTFSMDHEFYIMCYEYYQSFSELTRLRSEMDHLLTEQENIERNLFILNEQQIKSPMCDCGDGYQVHGYVKALTATLDHKQKSNLIKNQENLRNLYHDKIVEVNMLNRYFHLKVSRYIGDIIQNEPLFNNYLRYELYTLSVEDMMHKQNLRVEQDIAAVDRLKVVIQILLYFEQVSCEITTLHVPKGFSPVSVTISGENIENFRKEIRDWAYLSIASLLRVSTVEDNRFLIFEILKCKHIGSWGQTFLQFPGVDSDQAIDTFLAFLSLFLTPTFITENELVLSEEDYLSLWTQVPLFESMEYILSKCTEQFGLNQSNSTFSSFSQAFSLIDTVLYIFYQALSNFNKSSNHKSFTRMLSQNMARLVQMASNSLAQIEGTSQEDVEYLFNSFYVKCFKGLLSSSSSLWSFLSELPYEIISEPCACSIFWIMFRDEPVIDLKITYDILRDFDSWLKLVTEDKSLRNNFITLFQKPECSYLFPVMSRLGCSHSYGLAAIIVHELFLIGFINETSRDTYFRDATKNIVSICEIHPRLISLLLALVVKYLKFVGRYSLTMFKQLDLKTWKLSKTKDLPLLEELILKPLNSTEHELARFIIDHLAWNDSTKNKNLTLDVQKDILLLMARTVSTHKKDSQYSFVKKDPWIGLEEWCWSVAQRVKIYDSVQTPLIPIESIEHPSLNGLLHTIELSVKSGSIDGVSIYAVLALSDVGNNLEKYNEYSSGWFEAIVNNKTQERAIRLMYEISMRFCEQVKSQSSGVRTPTNLTFYPHMDSILYLDTKSSFISRLVSSNRYIGDNTQSLSTCICKGIQSLHASEKLNKLRSFTLFWVNEITKISNWTNNPCCLFLMNQISKVIIHLNMINVTGISNIISTLPEMDMFALQSSGIFTSSSTVITTSAFNKDINPQIQYPYFSFIYLIGLSLSEFHKRQQVANSLFEMRNTFPTAVKSFEAVKFCIYRVLAYCVKLTEQLLDTSQSPTDVTNIHSILPMYWQLFFHLYFEKQFTPMNTVRFFGYQFLEIPTKEKIFTSVLDRLESLKKFYTETQNTSFTTRGELIDLYYAMILWLKGTKDNFLYFIDQISSISKFHQPARIVSSINDDIARDTTKLWHDLIDNINIQELISSEEKNYISSIYPTFTSQSSTLSIKSRSLVFNNQKIDIIFLKQKEKEIMKYLPSVTITQEPFPRGFILNLSDLNAMKITQSIDIYLKEKEMQRRADEEYISLIPYLYFEVKKQASLSVPCYKEFFCKRPANIYFSYSESVKNNNNETRMKENRSLVMRIMDSKYVDHSLCNLLYELDVTLRNVNSQGLGSKLFYGLLQIHFVMCDRFVPFRKIMNHIVSQFASTFIMNQPTEMESLLMSMVQSNALISLLSPFFNPLLCPESWERFLEIILNKKKENPSSMSLQIYKNFDIQKWLASFYNIENIKSLMAHSVRNLRNCKMNEVIAFYLTLIPACINSYPSNLLAFTFSHMYSCMLELPYQLLESCNDTMSFENFDDSLLCDFIEITREFLWNVRKKHNNTLYNALPKEYLKEIVRLLEKFVCFSHLSNSFLQEGQVFEKVCRGYEAFILPVPAKTNLSTSGDVTILPFLDNQASMASSVLASFVRCNKRLLESNKGILNQVWNIYSQLIFNNILDPDCLNMYHQELMYLDWSNWTTINFEQISQMCAILEVSPQRTTKTILSGHRIFVKNIIKVMSWKIITDNIVLCHLSSEDISKVYSDIISLMVSSILKSTTPQVDESLAECVEKLFNFNIEWNRITVEHFSNILKLYSKLFIEVKNFSYNIPKRNLDLCFSILQNVCQPRESTASNSYPSANQYDDYPNVNPNYQSNKPLTLYYIDFIISTLVYSFSSKQTSPSVVDNYLAEQITQPFDWIIDTMAHYYDYNSCTEHFVQLLTFTDRNYAEFDTIFQFIIEKAFQHPSKLSICLFSAAQSVKNYLKSTILMEFALRSHISQPNVSFNYLTSILWLPPHEAQRRQFASACIEKGCSLLYFVQTLKRIQEEHDTPLIK
ncbi:hypothetical protein NAEGRDRAFT_56953 [Naegleria gruberi]|uniref:Uncharacterized protein n=1 Tax=Naegleria gruberi TaxID=5762 RepID=D2V2U9_NAEGR|nr:uncharacterized protein NAEGRDRAFT_56953 [Naegleria gruberi]EFC48960.1 hypothetical protein NAEGRDRAFT_56953 [Naegleria gruberi]|eukprot:XP_002681704.1 hypothetical protein NAEGRDRAFT_56953 [Naegleria gruberi strain NEG-M]